MEWSRLCVRCRSWLLYYKLGLSPGASPRFKFWWFRAKFEARGRCPVKGLLSMSFMEQLFLDRQETGDLDLICRNGDHEPTHLCIVSARSPVFKELLSKADSRAELQLPMIPNRAALLMVLEYCYLERIRTDIKYFP